MREIKFRGKRIDNGEWVFGDLIQWKCGSKDIAPMESDNIQYCVIPDTVGQFTGLKDKNGREIFEGDIVAMSYDYYSDSSYDDDCYCIGVIIYNQDMALYELQLIEAEMPFDDIKYNDEFTLCISTFDLHKGISLEGNIYDNPELLENNSK